MKKLFCKCVVFTGGRGSRSFVVILKSTFVTAATTIVFIGIVVQESEVEDHTHVRQGF